MATHRSSNKLHAAGVPESAAAVSIATGMFGAMAGLFAGAIAGPIGAFVGGVLGGAAGAITGRRLVIKQHDDQHDDELLDREIGVIDGDIGARQPFHRARVDGSSALRDR